MLTASAKIILAVWRGGGTSITLSLSLLDDGALYWSVSIELIFFCGGRNAGDSWLIVARALHTKAILRNGCRIALQKPRFTTLRKRTHASFNYVVNRFVCVISKSLAKCTKSIIPNCCVRVCLLLIRSGISGHAGFSMNTHIWAARPTDI